MKTEIDKDRIHIVILDIQGLYAQIHDEMWVNNIELDQIRHAYKNYRKWRIIKL